MERIMEKITYDMAHMKERPALEVGDILQKGDLIGFMGSTGFSTDDHLHISAVEGWISRRFHLSDMVPGRDLNPRPDHLLYILEDDGLFQVKPIITTPYCEVDYWKKYGKRHYGYDVIPFGWSPRKNWPMFWNRTRPGKVLAVDWDNGYGWYALIGFEG